MDEINYSDQIVDANGKVRGFRRSAEAVKLTPGPEIKNIEPSADVDPGSQDKEYKINLGGTEICLDEGAKKDWRIMYFNNAAVLVRAGSDYDRVKAAVTRAYAEADSWGSPLEQAQLQKEIINEFVGTSVDFPAQPKVESSIEIVLVSTKDGRSDKKTRIDKISIGERHTSVLAVGEQARKLQYSVEEYSDFDNEKSDGIQSSISTKGNELAWILVDSSDSRMLDNITGGPARALDSGQADVLMGVRGKEGLRRNVRNTFPVADNPVADETVMAGIARVIARAKSHNIRSDAPMVRRNVPGSTGVVVIK